MVKAARKYRVAQTGSQQRSAPHLQKLVELISEAHRQGRVDRRWNTENDTPRRGCSSADGAPLPGLDWEMYLGPAPKVASNSNRDIWNYPLVLGSSARHDDGSGTAPTWTLIEWAMKAVDGPLSASVVGGRYCLKDNCQTRTR